MKHAQRLSQSSRSDLTRTVDADQITRAEDGAAQPLSLETRALLEPLFGHSFGDVRVFNDSAAAQTADALHAKAFTVGQHISFAQHLYQPDTPHGQRLLMHELAHTIQQGRVGTLPKALEVSRRGDAGEQNANAVVAGLGTTSRPSVSSVSPAVQCEDEAAPSVDWSLDPRNPHAQATMPIGSGTGTASVNTTAASLQLQTPDLTAQAGYDWQKGLNADLKYQLDPATTLSAQASSNGVAGQFQMPNLQLNGGYVNGAPYANGQGQLGPFQGQAAYDPTKGFTAQGSAVWPGGSGYLGTSGAGAQQQIGPVTAGVNTDFNRANAFVNGQTDIAGVPLSLSANAGVGLNGYDPSLGAKLTAPNLVSVGGVSASPYVGVDLSGAGVNPSAGLGISGNLPELF